MDEESGGRGRQAYTAAHSAEFREPYGGDRERPGAAHPLGFNAKMSRARDGVPAAGAGKSAEYWRERDQGRALRPGADISGMSQAGVPTLGIMQDGRTYFNYHHTAADTLDKIVPCELRENAAAMAVMGYALASTTSLYRGKWPRPLSRPSPNGNTYSRCR